MMPNESQSQQSTNPAQHPARGPGVGAAPARPLPANPKELGYAPTDREAGQKKALEIAKRLASKAEAEKKGPKALQEVENKSEEELEKVADDVTDDDDDVDEDELETGAPEPTDEVKEGDDKGDKGKPTDEETEAAKKEAAAVDRIHKAKQALLRDGMKPAILAKLSDEEVLEFGEARANEQKKADGYGNEMKKLRDQLAGRPQPQQAAPEKKAPAEGEDKSRDAGQGKEERAAEVALDPYAIIDSVADQTGPEIHDGLKKAFKAMEDSFAEKLKAKDAELSVSTQAARSMLLSSARRDLSGSFPQVKDANQWSKVVDFATALANSGRYGDGDESRLFEDAARAAFPDANETAQRQLLAKQKVAKRGQIDRGGDNRGGGSKSLTSVDRATLAGTLLKQGKKPEAIRRILAAKA